MQANTFILDVDIKQNNYINEPVIKQNDAVIFIINLTDNGAPVDLTDVTTYTIATERADGVSIVSVGTKTGPSQVTFNMPRETTTSVGRAKVTVQLYDADKRVSSFTFPMVVEKDPSASLIVTGGDKTLIEIVLGEGPKVIEDAKTATSAANTATGKANTAASNADSKASAANTAAGAANTAAGKANASATAADLAAGKVDTAIANTNASASAADTAAGKANTAATNADAKAGLAQTAADNANAEATGLGTMKSDVLLATGNANDATLSANAAAGKANASSSAADISAANADTEATNAQTKATHANTQGDYAKTQGDYAKLQGNHAKAEGDKAALETADLTGMKTAVTNATADAVTAAELANTEATGLSGMKADVVSATASATDASTQATTQAAYAKEQGDYAKGQGDAVQGVFDAGLVASVNGKTGAVVIGASDVGAETPTGAQIKVDTHADLKNNPHAVTKSQVGLTNVDNVKQASKVEFDSHIDDYMPHDSGLNEYASSPDADGIYTVLELKRTDDTLYMKSVLSTKNPEGQYTKATWTFYRTNGSTVALTKTWTISYNDDGMPVTKEVA